jgi:hypothetical protein
MSSYNETCAAERLVLFQLQERMILLGFDSLLERPQTS